MPNGLPTEISGIVGRKTRLILAIPEHRVSNPGGTRASQSDVFALLSMAEGTYTLTFEALNDRPFGDSVSDWEYGTAGSDAILDRMREVFGNAGRSPRPRPISTLSPDRVGDLRGRSPQLRLHRNDRPLLFFRR